MKGYLNYCIFIASLLCVGCEANRSGVSHASRELGLNCVSLSNGEKWYTLRDLDSIAKAYLLDHKTGFDGNAREVTFWIDDRNRNELVMISYNSGFGRHYWNVTIDKTGAINKVESGILAEGPPN